MQPQSSTHVRQFWLDTFQKLIEGRTTLTSSPTERLALEILAAHPEFHDAFKSSPTLLTQIYPAGELNPFLHLSMHLAVQEQINANQPTGLRSLFEQLQTATGSVMQAQHHVMDSLEHTLAQAQQTQSAPDALAYLVDVSRKLSELGQPCP